MSLYQVQQCLFDYLRALENAPADAPRPELSIEGYDLTTKSEPTLLSNGDIAAIYALGTHPVIINGYCRAMGTSVPTTGRCSKPSAHPTKGRLDGRHRDGLLGLARADDGGRSRVGSAGAGGQLLRRAAAGP